MADANLQIMPEWGPTTAVPRYNKSITGGNSLVPAAIAVNVVAADFLPTPPFFQVRLSLENKILLSNPTKPNYPNVKDAGKRAGAK